MNRPGRPGWPGGNWPGGSWGGGNRWNGNNFWNINNNNYFGSNWSGAYYGNWYHGGWGSGFWRGFATGIGTSWGASALYYPRYTYQTWGRLPVTWHAPIYGSWGLSSIAPNWMYAGYTNPYVSTANQQVVVMVPGTGSNAAESVTAYDYSQPIDTSAGPPEPDVADAAQQLFDSARSQFRSGNYGQALVLTDQALLSMPNDPVLHEFRSLVLFALQRYPEATTAAYAVLSAGPGWDWTTLVGLYDSVETYTAQLRRLEAYVRSNSNAAESQFLLGYHYLVQGHQQQAGQRFAKAAQLRPQDTLARRFAEAFADDPAGSPAPLPAPTPEALEDAQRSGPPPAPPEQLYGRWTAVPSEGVVIRLQLNPAGDFTWSVTEGNRTQTIQGQSSYADQVLVLGQEEGPPLAGKVSLDNSGRILAFKPTGAPEAAEGLRFQREAI